MYTEAVGRALLTGASGFIGRHVLPSLLRNDFEVHAALRTPLGIPRVREHRVDLFDASSVSRLMQSVQPTHLIHLAWYTRPPEYWQSPINTEWEHCSLELFESFVASGGKRLVGAGSCAEYEWGSDVLTENVTPECPATPYGSAKLSLKRRTQELAFNTGVSFSWARLFFLFGPHERKERFVPSIIESLMKREQAVCRHGDLVRDLLYVEDAADAVVALAKSEVEGTVNVASGDPSRLGDIAREIGIAMQLPELVHVASEGQPGGEPRSLVASTSRLSQEVGWRPRFARHEGIHRTIEWRVAQGRINAA